MANARARLRTKRIFNLMIIGADRRARNAFIQSLLGENNMEEENGLPLLNFGKVKSGPYDVNLYGIPSDPRFAKIWQAFAPKVEGMILLGGAGSEKDISNLNYALSLLREDVKGPAILVNTDPVHYEIPLEENMPDVKTFTCFPSDRIRAAGILKDLLAELNCR